MKWEKDGNKEESKNKREKEICKNKIMENGDRNEKRK